MNRLTKIVLHEHGKFSNKAAAWHLMGILFLFIFSSSAAAELTGQIVFSTQEALCVLHVDDLRSRNSESCIRLPNKNDSAHHPVWMPNASGILFEHSFWANTGDLKRDLAVISQKTKQITNLQVSIPNRTELMSYPNWSPDGRYLALVRSEPIKSKEGQSLMTLFIIDKAPNDYRVVTQNCAASPVSWSSDSKALAFRTGDGAIAIYNMAPGTITILNKGSYPIFHPATKQIFYISQDKHLYCVNTDNTNIREVDNTDWSWSQLIGISDDGVGLFFVEASSLLWWEYNTINYFSFDSRKKKVLSKWHAIMHGASLYQGQ